MKKSELIPYKWHGINKKGHKVKGKRFNVDVMKLQAELKQQGIELIKAKRIRYSTFGLRKSTKGWLLVIFSRQLATMISAGIPLIKSLEIITRSTQNLSLQKILLTVKTDISAGQPLNTSLSKHSHFFNILYINLIKIGEQSGTLDIMLTRLANHTEKVESLKKKLRKTLYYPTVVMSMGLIVICLLVIFIIPRFEDLFISFGTQLPVFTKALIAVSLFLRDKFFLLMGGLVVTIFSLQYSYEHFQKMKRIVDAIKLHLPIFGPLLKKIIIARMTRSFAILLSAGIPLLDALQTIASITNNYIYKKSIFQLYEDILTGQQVHTAMNQSYLFPDDVIQMIAVAEESGMMDDMLHKIANFYEEDAENLVNGLFSLTEPLIIVILGLVIGTIVLAIYLPIFKLGSII